ncbi:chemotaxis protein MotC [Ciceribacter lividus]|uniref:Chemotaxis protein MotC n=1 Tax=Ciceribacter lividus TaxID=1197950 RepID=A0A6I7HNJ6_9HYPH|nr:chemotaxis protein MotC [Ciceribacter lividus]RCW27269.1 chemotaxis protein MotC [Ciceribacter lividus]
MASLRRFLFGSALAVLGLSGPGQVRSEDLETIAPYKMLRSLQFVQDSVVLGDHSAGEMQRFMLETIDKRLRQADASVFESTDNVDAALIYAMSGGNPQTLEYLVARDVDGNFDNRVTDALRKYLAGKGTLIAKSLGELVWEYKDSKIVPYLALVAGNVMISTNPKGALKFYDWARLTAPGTIVEEAALRRSVAIAIEAGDVPKAATYANRYARRFLHSPYASQFADLFVRLVVERYELLNADDVSATLGYMDKDRAREIYLRIARAAAVRGKNQLAGLAAERAKALSGTAEGADTLARLYGGLAEVPTSGILSAVDALASIPEKDLSPADRALRAAAEAVAREILSQPVQEGSSPQPADAPATAVEAMATPEQGEPLQFPGEVPASETVAKKTAPATTKADEIAMDPQFRDFVSSGRSRLQEIDSLLQEEAQ